MPALTTAPPYPRSRLTLTETITRVKRDLGLSGSNLLSTEDITEWLNQAQEEFAKETRWFKFSLSISAVASQAEYPFPDAAAAQVLSIDWVRVDDRDIYPLGSQGRLDRGAFDWRDQVGTPTHWFLRGMSTLRLWPTPSAAGSANIDVFGTGLPPVIAHPEDQFYVPNGYDAAFQAYAKMRATQKDAHGEGARRLGMFEAEWMRALEKGKQSVSEADEWSQVFLGRDALTQDGWGSMQIPPYTNIQAPP